MKAKQLLIMSLAVLMAAVIASPVQATEEIGSIDIKHIQTPDKVETSIGTLRFIDGAPLPETRSARYRPESL